MYKYMDNFQKNNIEQIVESFRKYNGTVDINLVSKLARGLTFATENTRSSFISNLNALHAKASLQSIRVSTPCLPLPEKRTGDITIGTLVQGTKEYGPVGLSVVSLCHSLVLGTTGTGKSNLVWYIIKQLIEKDCKVFVIDRNKDMRNIVSEVPVAVLDANDLRINLFDPPVPEINTRSWISKVCDLFTIFGLYYSSRNYIKEFVIGLLDETGEIPTLFDVFSFMKSKKERGETRQRYSEASLNKIENIVEELGPCLKCKKSFPLTELFSIPVAIEVDQLSMQSERFLVAFFLLALREIRKAQSVRGNPGIDRDSIFVCVDEAANLWNPMLDFSERVQEMSLDTLQETPLIARDRKICLIFSSQRPLSRNVMANTRTKVVSNMADAEDAWHVSNALGVDPKLFQKLGVGEFVVKTGNVEPFLIRTEKIERKIVDDEVINELKKPFVEHIQNNCVPLTEKASSQEQAATTLLNQDSKKLLINVARFPSLTVTQRYSMLSLKGAYAQDVKNSLINQELIEEVFLAIGSSKQSTFLVPTQKAVDYLTKANVDCAFYKHVGKTSALHQLIQAMIIEYYTVNGWNTRHDYQVEEKLVDIYVENKNTKIIYEVAVNPAIDIKRVESCLPSVDQFVVVATGIMVLKNIENTLQGLKTDKIKLYLASNYLGKLRKSVLDYYTKNTLEQQNSENNSKLTTSIVEQAKNRSTM